MQPDERIIRKEKDGYHVYSEDGKKHLGGPYKSEAEAKKRLEQIDYFKNKGQKAMIFTPEKRFLTLEMAEIRARKTEKGPVIEGYAAKFGKLSQDLGGFVEKIDKSAFTRCLERCDVRGLRNHDPSQLLGRTGSGTMRLSVDETGLRYEIDLPDTQTGRDTYTEVERGDLSGSSFTFTLDPDDGDDWDDETSPPTRTLRNVRDLFDVGPVTFPAYLDTDANARAMDRLIESRELIQRGRLKQVQRIRLLKLRLGQPIFERG